MARSLKKGPFVRSYLLKKLKTLGEKKQVIKTQSRRSTIFPQFIGHTFAITVKNIYQYMLLRVGRINQVSLPTRTYHGHGKRC